MLPFPSVRIGPNAESSLSISVCPLDDGVSLAEDVLAADGSGDVAALVDVVSLLLEHAARTSRMPDATMGRLRMDIGSPLRIGPRAGRDRDTEGLRASPVCGSPDRRMEPGQDRAPDRTHRCRWVSLGSADGVVPVVQRQVGVVQPLPLKIVRPGASPVRQGEVAATAWIVESGLLRMWAIDDSGRELVLDLLGPGDLVGEGEGDGAVSAWTVTSLKPGRLRPAGSGELAEARAVRQERITALACQLAWLGVRDRIEVRLAELASRIGRAVPGGILLPPMTQDDIASLVGTTRESANRALRLLVARDRLSVERPGRYVVRPRLHAVPG